MNFLKKQTTWSNTELGFLKICLISLGVILGVFYHSFLSDYLLFFFGAYLFIGVWAFYRWIQKMKKS
jgi:hypothetical protein